ncbi:MAG: hypothetical protein Tsb0015_17240 [Simkaniaceae bacterium]
MKNTYEFRMKLQEILKKNPNDLEALIQLGALEFEFFHHDKLAISLLEKAIELEPKNVEARFWLAACLFYDLFEYERAKKILHEALTINPNLPDCLSLMAWILYEKDKALKKAKEYVQKAIIYAPDWPMLRYQLAEILLDDGKIVAAEEEIHKAMQIPSLTKEAITSDVQQYYENVITGRSWDEKEKKSSHLLKRLKIAKLEKKN